MDYPNASTSSTTKLYDTQKMLYGKKETVREIDPTRAVLSVFHGVRKDFQRAVMDGSVGELVAASCALLYGLSSDGCLLTVLLVAHVTSLRVECFNR